MVDNSLASAIEKATALGDCYTTKIYGLWDEKCLPLVNGIVPEDELPMWRDVFERSSYNDPLINEIDKHRLLQHGYTREYLEKFAWTLDAGDSTAWIRRQKFLLERCDTGKYEYPDNNLVDMLDELARLGQGGVEEANLLSRHLASDSQAVRLAALRATKRFLACDSCGNSWGLPTNWDEDCLERPVFANYGAILNKDTMKGEIEAIVRMAEELTVTPDNYYALFAEKYDILSYLFQHPQVIVQRTAVDTLLNSKDITVRHLVLELATNPNIKFTTYRPFQGDNVAVDYTRSYLLKKIQNDISPWIDAMKDFHLIECGAPIYISKLRDLAKSLFTGMPYKELLKMAATDDYHISDAALTVGYEARVSDNRLIKQSLKQLRLDNDADLQLGALRMLNRIHEHGYAEEGDSLNALALAEKGANPEIRGEAIAFLTADFKHTPKTIPAVANALTTEDLALRGAATSLLAHNDDLVNALTTEQLLAVTSLLDNANRYNEDARSVLFSYKEEAAPIVLQAARGTGTPQQRAGAVDLFANMFMKKALDVPEFIQLFNDPEPEVRLAILKNINFLGASALEDDYNARGLGDKDDRVRYAALDFLSKRYSVYSPIYRSPLPPPPPPVVLKSLIAFIGNKTVKREQRASATIIINNYPTESLPYVVEACMDNRFAACVITESTLKDMDPFERLYHSYKLFRMENSPYLKSVGYKVLYDTVYDLIN